MLWNIDSLLQIFAFADFVNQLQHSCGRFVDVSDVDETLAMRFYQEFSFSPDRAGHPEIDSEYR